MSNYTIQVAWSSKDSLLDSDPAKVISGDDFNTEFTAVQAAVNTKADIAGSATQPFSAITAPSGTNTTQVATTAFVQAATPPMGIDTVIVDGAAGATGKNIYIDNDAPASEGNNGDIWFEY